MSGDYTDSERKILATLFSVTDMVLKLQGGYMDIDGESFGRGDLFCLAGKIGIDEYG